MNPMSWKRYRVCYFCLLTDYAQSCHPEERGISARNSAIKISNLCKVAYGDPSFLGMTNYGVILWLLRLKWHTDYTDSLCENADKRGFFIMHQTQSCHPEERGISARNSTKNVTNLCRLTSVILPPSGWQDCGCFEITLSGMAHGLYWFALRKRW